MATIWTLSALRLAGLVTFLFAPSGSGAQGLGAGLALAGIAAGFARDWDRRR